MGGRGNGKRPIAVALPESGLGSSQTSRAVVFARSNQHVVFPSSDEADGPGVAELVPASLQTARKIL